MTERTQVGVTDYGINRDTSNEASLNNPNDLVTGASVFESFGYRFNRKLVGTGDIIPFTKFMSTLPGTFVPEKNDMAVFQPDDPQHELINTTDQDFIFTYGIGMRYYPIKDRAEQTFFNDTYNESASREYYGAVLEKNSRFAFLTETNPTVVYGIYAPSDPEQLMTPHSIDTTRSSVFYFNIVYFRKLLGRDPVIGDVIFPFEVPQSCYEIMSVKPSNKTLYMPRRWKCGAVLAQWSL
jgi:hypothetical protein